MIWGRGRRRRNRVEREVDSEAPAERFDSLREEIRIKNRILDSLGEAVMLADSTGRIVYANAAAQALIAAAPHLGGQALEGKTEISIRHPESRILAARRSDLADGGSLLIFEDVTEERLAGSVRRDFVANVSHELKTPVASILASAETLDVTLKEDPGRAAGFAASLTAEARRLSQLVEDLLDLARLEDEPLQPAPVDLSGLVAAEVSKARDEAALKSLELTGKIEPAVFVRGVEKELTLAVRNLIENALRYTEQGRVEVRLQASGGEARLEISDTGLGIPAKDIPRVFERFYRVDKARSRESGGTGLGLSIVRHVAERHGGSVWAESEFGKGSRFLLTIPEKSSIGD